MKHDELLKLIDAIKNQPTVLLPSGLLMRSSASDADISSGTFSTASHYREQFINEAYSWNERPAIDVSAIQESHSTYLPRRSTVFGSTRSDPIMSRQSTNTGAILAQFKFDFDYSNNLNFQLPPWPFYPPGAKPYDYGKMSFQNFTHGFNKVVGSMWGRMINSLDGGERGVNQFVGETMWGKSAVEVKKDVMDGASFARLTKLSSVYYDNHATEQRSSPILLAGNIGKFRFGMILIPMEQIKRMPYDDANNCFGKNIHHGASIQLKNISIPFPFYAEGVGYDDYQCYDNVNMVMTFEASTAYALALVAIHDTKTQELVIRVPDKADSALLSGHTGYERTSISMFTRLASIVEKAQARGLLAFGSLTTPTDNDAFNSETASNFNLLLQTFRTSELPTHARFEKVDTDDFPVPVGLTELPMLPDAGYTYIADFQGILYVSDVNRMKVMMPYQVFDLVDMRKKNDNYQKLEPQSTSEAQAIQEVGRQIELIEALFKHQAEILIGTAYAYEAMNYVA